jgi:predicted GNAT family acetyltransferase
MLSPMEVQIRAGGSSDDVNTVVRLHGEVYEAEYGLDPSFAADVALRLSERRRRGWPGPRDGLWIAETDGGPVGSITLDDQGGGLGQLGHLVLPPEPRGTGPGRRLVDPVLAAARAAG